MAWTKEQQEAIDVRGRRILVSAAAGSGKTAVLVERIIQRITDPYDPIDVDALLVMTFTKAAAAEMKERITKRLEALLLETKATSPTYERLRIQTTLVEAAQISTIDSFCLNIIRENIDQIDLDPIFKIADENELSLLKADVLTELLEEEYIQGEENFLKLADAFATGKGDEKITFFIENLYRFAMSKAWPKSWLYGIEEGTSWQIYIYGQIQLVLGDILKRIDYAIEVCQMENGPIAYLSTFLDEKSQLEYLMKAENFLSLSASLEHISFARLGSARKVDERLKTIAKGIRDSYKKLLLSLKEDFFADEERLAQEEVFSGIIIHELVRLTIAYIDRLAQIKKEKHIADFYDIEHMALEILTNEKGEKSEIAKIYQRKFKEIYIDEYQDSNYLQEELVCAIENHNIFMVGDVKQSIYAFRQASPEIFNEKYKRFGTYEEGGDVRIVLSKNFRSRKGVLESINHIFFKIMKESIGGISYDEAVALYPGASYSDLDNGQIAKSEMLLVSAGDMDTDDTKVEVEARLIANQIKEMFANGFCVSDKGNLRKLAYRDIAILLRSASKTAENFAKVLVREGIPAYAMTATGYFMTLEVRSILSILSCIDNPLQDIPMAAFLKSPIVEMTDIELSILIAWYKKEYAPQVVRLYEALKSGVENESLECKIRIKIQKALVFLERYQMYATYMGIYALIEHIYDKTDFLSYMSSLPAGEGRVANLMMLLEKAKSFADAGYRGLFHFVRYIEKLREYDTDFGEAMTIGEHEDTVRIMTIHKSKGLEFPICFVSAIHKHFNEQDIRSSLVIDSVLGIGCDFIDIANHIKDDSIKKNVIKYKKKVDMLGEELRILYVALTRAKEKLFLTGVVKDAREIFEKCTYIEDTPSVLDIKAATSYLDLVLIGASPVSLKKKEVKYSDLIRIEEEKQQDIQEIKEKIRHIQPVKDLAVDEMLHFTYPYEVDISLHTKVSVSELKRRWQEEEKEFVIDLSGFEVHDDLTDDNIDVGSDILNYETGLKVDTEMMGRKVGILATERGNAYHRLLQIIDYSKLDEKHIFRSLRAEIERLQAQGGIKTEEVYLIYLPKIVTFLESELGKRFAKAYREGYLYREQQFMFGMPARELKMADSDEMVMIQGVIDAYIIEENYVYMVDYKTDKVNDEETLIQRYQLQLEYYKMALSRLIKDKEIKKVIYSFGLDKELSM